MYRIGIDLGGTNIALGIVDEKKRILHKASEPTNLPRSAESLTEAIAELVMRELDRAGISAEEVEAAGIGIPGTVNPVDGIVEYANNFGFVNVPLKALLQEKLPFPLHAANDAKAAAWGEYQAGAGKGSRSMLMITLGTGVGGAMIINGSCIEGYNYAAGEIGHMVIRQGGKPCTCGRRGCLEAYASASALTEQAREAAAENPDSLLLAHAGGNLEKINGKVVMDCVAAGDETAKRVFDQYLSYLAEGTANLINILQPERVVIGGGLSGAGEALLSPLRQLVSPMLYSRDSSRNAQIAAAELGNDAGIIGAAFWQPADSF